MAVGSFTARSGVSFPLFNIQDVPQFQAAIDESVFIPLSMSDGSMIGTGNGPLPITHGDLSATFHINTAWLGQHGYPMNLAGMESARQAWMKTVLRGGLGVVTDNLPAGTLNPSGISLPSPYTRNCTAIVVSHNAKPQAGSLPVLEIDCVLRCPVGYWTNCDGTLVYFG